MKKAILVFLCILLCVSLVLTSCGKADEGKPQATDNGSQANNQSAKSDAQGGGSGSGVSAPGTLPIVKDKLTLRYAVKGHPLVADFKTNQFVKFMEEKTNVHIEWQVIPAQGLKEKVNIILASGDYPDVFYGCDIDLDQQAQYGMEEKVFIPLNDLISEQGFFTKKALDYFPMSWKMITLPDGKIYGLPTISDCTHCSLSRKMWMNDKWLKNLGLKVPTTTDEFYEVLKAFKDKDPNGNGKKDELPLVGSTLWNGSVDLFLMGAFLYYDGTPFALNNGKIEVAVKKPEYREGLRYLNKMFKENLIYEGSFTMDAAQAKKIYENPEAVIAGAFPCGYSGGAITMGTDYYRQYKAISPLKGHNGIQYAAYTPYGTVYQGHFMITKQCKNPEVAFKWADYIYDYEPTMRNRYGVPGEGWKKSGPDEIGINGKPALWTSIIPWGGNTPRNDSLTWIGPFFEPSDLRLGQAVPKDLDLFTAAGLSAFLEKITKEQYDPYRPPKGIESLPPLTLLKAENDEVLTVRTEIDKYVSESRVRFITGDLSIDKDWDKYVSDLDKLGLPKLMQIYEKAYGRQYK